MRQLATVREISKIIPIEGADSIVTVQVDDWYCVALKDEFKEGDNCVYFEIDSFIPIMPQVEHLRAKAFKRLNDQEGIRIKTIKLRGQISQGLALPLSKFPEVHTAFHKTRLYTPDEEYFDVTDLLGVQLYEVPIPGELAGQVSGNFPRFIERTKQARCQNIGKKIFGSYIDTVYETSLKMDGTSFTGFYYKDEDKLEEGVCGRNWVMELDEWNQDNKFVRMYIDSGLRDALSKVGKNIAVQGELIGPGVGKNREGLKHQKVFVFDIFDIDTGKYLGQRQREDIMLELYYAGLKETLVTHVPIIESKVTMADLGITDVAGLLKHAERPSLNHPIAEGMVYKSIDGQFSFKVISNKYLLKQED